VGFIPAGVLGIGSAIGILRSGRLTREKSRTPMATARVAPRRESNPASKPSTTTPQMPNRRRDVGFTIGYIATMLVALWLFQVLLNPMLQAAARDIPYSEFRTTVKAGQVVDVSLGSPRITGHMKNAAATSERDRIVHSVRSRPLRTQDCSMTLRLRVSSTMLSLRPVPSDPSSCH